jgi:hypothetical protein
MPLLELLQTFLVELLLQMKEVHQKNLIQLSVCSVRCVVLFVLSQIKLASNGLYCALFSRYSVRCVWFGVWWNWVVVTSLFVA